MSTRKRFAAGAIGVAGVLIALVGTLGGPGTAGESNAALALTGGVAGGAAMGWYQHVAADRENDEREMAIDYRAGYVGFWALYWFLFIFAMAGIGEGGDGGVTYDLPLESHSLVLTAWVLGTVVLFVAKARYKRQF